jgi:quercetin 2,3-dioxygenase
MSAPRYQGITAERIPTVSIGEHASLRLIAGKFHDSVGPAATFSPILLADLQADEGNDIEIPLPANHTTALVVRQGSARLTNGERIETGHIGVFAHDGETLRFKAEGDLVALILAGEPLNEPIVGSGPFVMNSEAEIRQAIDDYQSGKMGQLG